MTNEKAIMCLEDMKIKIPIPKAAKQARENNEALDVAIKALKNEPHWIPVTKDTPTEDDDYWCTFDAETGRFVDWCGWYKGQWVVWIDGSPNPVSNVIAWCKPFEPYKGATE